MGSLWLAIHGVLLIVPSFDVSKNRFDLWDKHWGTPVTLIDELRLTGAKPAVRIFNFNTI